LIHLIRVPSIEAKNSNDRTNNFYDEQSAKQLESCELITRLHAGDCFDRITKDAGVCGAQAVAYSMVVSI
jgi:hypothetical protein